jgi:hypothetical protein
VRIIGLLFLLYVVAQVGWATKHETQQATKTDKATQWVCYDKSNQVYETFRGPDSTKQDWDDWTKRGCVPQAR